MKFNLIQKIKENEKCNIFTNFKDSDPFDLRYDDQLNLRPYGNTEVLYIYSLTEEKEREREIQLRE